MKEQSLFRDDDLEKAVEDFIWEEIKGVPSTDPSLVELRKKLQGYLRRFRKENLLFLIKQIARYVPGVELPPPYFKREDLVEKAAQLLTTPRIMAPFFRALSKTLHSLLFAILKRQTYFNVEDLARALNFSVKKVRFARDLPEEIKELCQPVFWLLSTSPDLERISKEGHFGPARILYSAFRIIFCRIY